MYDDGTRGIRQSLFEQWHDCEYAHVQGRAKEAQKADSACEFDQKSLVGDKKKRNNKQNSCMPKIVNKM